MKATIRFAILNPALIFNLCSPRYLPEISLNWKGKHPWHDRRYEPLRDLMERLYVEGFNRSGGHYRHLEESIGREGFRNPIMASVGKLERRKLSELPPRLHGGKFWVQPLICEYLGGSRLWIAQIIGLLVPCIINDYCNAFPEAEVLPDIKAVLSKFRDQPARISINAETGAVEMNDMPYVHLPADKRYSLAQQSRIRRGIVDEISTAVIQWLSDNDKE